METKFNHCDRMRIRTGYKENFIDISGADNEACLTVDLYPHFQYIEMRAKKGQMRLFTFDNKRWKKEYDFGWWADAEVVFSRNNVKHG